MARHLVEAQAVRGAAIVGQAGGWSVLLKIGMHDHPLVAQRSGGQPRLWRSLDACVDYLKRDLRVARFELDASGHSEPTTSLRRPDSAERLRRAHAAAAAEHDRWFRDQVEIGVAEADDPNTRWVSHEEVMAEGARERAALVERIAKEGQGKGPRKGRRKASGTP